MSAHIHRLDVVDAVGHHHVLVSTVSQGDPHGHEFTLVSAYAITPDVEVPVGTTVEAVMDRGSTDHRHFVVFQVGETAKREQTTVAYSPVLVASVEAIKYECYGSLDLVRLPESLEQDVPNRYRYWETDDVEHGRQLRDALIRSEICKSIQLVDGERRLVTERDGRSRLRRDSVPDDYVGVLQPKLAGEVLEKSLVERALDCDVRYYNDDTVADFASANGVSRVTQVERLLLTAKSATVIDVDNIVDDLSDDTRSLAWRSEWTHKWHVSTRIPVIATFKCAVIEKDVGLFLQRAPQVDDASVGDLVCWVSKHLDDPRVRGTVPWIVRAENLRGEDAGQSVYDALGVVYPRLHERVTKAFDGGHVQLIQKSDERHEATFIVLQPVGDLDTDLMSPDEIRKTAEGYIRYCRKFGLNHEGSSFSDDELVLVGHWVFDEDVTIFNRELLEGTWIVKAKSSDPHIWEQVQSGILGGISPQGVARRELLSEPVNT